LRGRFAALGVVGSNDYFVAAPPPLPPFAAALRARAGARRALPRVQNSLAKSCRSEAVLEQEVRVEDIAFLEQQLNEHNMGRTGRRDFQALALFERDADGIVAGLSGFTWAGWLEIKLLWVREDQRGRGLGRQLLAAAEAEARTRGCRHVWLDSYSFQAPGFYQRLGYEVFGVLDDYPAAEKRVFLTKTL
jgi:ribosomal protein S18 acetylase RimI-like enzyme